MKKLYLFTVLIFLTVFSRGQVTVTVTPNDPSICLGSAQMLTASATSGSPGTITYSWSPSTNLNATTGATVYASPEDATTYTVTATNLSTNETGNASVTIKINPESYSLAADAGGASVCRSLTVSSGGTLYRDVNCKMIANIVPNGASPVTGTINTCTRLYATANKMGTSNLYAVRKYDIEPTTNAASATADITLYYTQKEFDDFNDKAADSGFKKLPTGPTDMDGLQNLCIKQFHGTGLYPEMYTGGEKEFTLISPGVTVNWNEKFEWWEVTVPVVGFSGFYLTSQKSNLIVLPITLEYFRGSQPNKTNSLNWKVNCTSANVAFEIERSANGQAFTAIGQIQADQVRCSTPFNFADVTPLNGKNYYRLKIINEDGKFQYSNIVLLNFKINKFELAGLNPNPVQDKDAVLKINAVEKNEIILSVTDISGRHIQHQTAVLRQGTNSIKINTSGLPQGAFLLGAYMPGEEPQTIQFIKR